MAKAKNIFSEDDSLFREELGKMRKNSKWFLVWQNTIDLKDFKPFETRKIKIERLNVKEIIYKEYDKDIKNEFDSFVTKWKAVAIYDKLSAEKEIIIEIDI